MGAQVKLTNDTLKHAMPEPGKRLELRDDVEPGLIFRVTDGGIRTWSVRYRNAAGEQRRKSLGPYPSVPLAEARARAREIKGAVAGGSDVVGLDLAQRAAEAGKKLHRLDALATAYFEDAKRGLHKANAKAPKRETTITEERRVFDKLISPALDKPVPDIKRSDVQALVTKVSRKSPANGKQCLAIVRQLMSYAVRKEIIDTNPAHDIAVATLAPRERVLTDKEVRTLWKALERPASVKGLLLSYDMALALRLALVTLQRGGEVVGMAWSEVDEKRALWTIPAARMKGKRTHLVPLSPLALSLISEAKALHTDNGDQSHTVIRTQYDPTPFVFPSPRTDTHMDRRAFSRAMNRVATALKLKPTATPHDFRRTGATNLTSERGGVPRFIVSQVIGHSGDTGGAAAVTGRHYDLNDYLPEKRKALDAWARLLVEIVSAKDHDQP